MCIRDDKGGILLAKTMWSSPISNVDLHDLGNRFCLELKEGS
jgi:hypothetical protein